VVIGYQLVKSKLPKVYGPRLRRLVAAGLSTVVLDGEKEVIRQALDTVPADERRLQVLLNKRDVQPNEPFSLLSKCCLELGQFREASHRMPEWFLPLQMEDDFGGNRTYRSHNKLPHASRYQNDRQPESRPVRGEDLGRMAGAN
jgi:hypothetical protein